MIINDIPLQALKDILASDTPLAIQTTEALIARLEKSEKNLESALEANKSWAHRSSRETSALFEANSAIRRVRAMAQDWDANGNSCGLGDPAADVWHATANAIRSTLDGDTRG